MVFCGDCGVAEGEFHERCCDRERCPFCGGQLITCACALKHFYPSYRDIGEGTDSFEEWQARYRTLKAEGRAHELSGIPKEVYELGLTDDQTREWENLLEEKGRVPWIQYPNLCGRCGKRWPEMFHVPDKKWEHYIEPAMRGEILCWDCYDWIVTVIDTAAELRTKGD